MTGFGPFGVPDLDVVRELEKPDEQKKIYYEKKKRDGGMYMKIYFSMLDHPDWRKANRNKWER